MKKLVKAIIATTLIGAALLGAPKKANSLETYFDTGISFGFTYNHKDALLQDISQDIRAVPKHADDTYVIGDIAPIRNASISVPVFDLWIKEKLGFGLRQNLPTTFPTGFDFKAGISGEENIALPYKSIESNYTNAPGTEQRGEGAALTYFTTFQYPTTGMYLRGSYFVSGFNIFMEYAPEFNFIGLQNGWDRYNHYQVKDSWFYSSTLDHTFKFGINGHLPLRYDDKSPDKFVDLECFAGVGVPTILYKNDTLCKENGLTNPYFIVGCSLGFSLEVPIYKEE